MKILIILFLSLFVVISCEIREVSHETSNIDQSRQEAIVSVINTPRGISIQKIDSCEYIYAETTHGVAICHKANCTNQIH